MASPTIHLLQDAFASAAEYANRARELTTGYAGPELLRTDRSRRLPWYADGRTAAEVHKEVLSGGSFQGSVSLKRKEGTPFLLQEGVAPLREDGAPPVSRLVSTARDITTERHSEERFACLSSFEAPEVGDRVLQTGLGARSVVA